MRRFHFISGALFTLMLVMATCMSLHAQIVSQSARFEREQKHSEPAWTIISMREKGVALLRDKEKYEGNQKFFEIITLDTTLKESSFAELQIPAKMHLVGYEYIDDFIYVLFTAGETNLSELMLLGYNIISKETQRYEIKHQFNLRLTHFSVVDRHAVFGGYVTREPAVLIYGIDDKQLKVVPGFFTQDTELLDLRVNSNGTFNTLTTNRSSRQQKSLVLRTFDANGTQLLEDEIEIDPNKIILGGLTSTLIHDNLLVAGTYSSGNSKVASGFFSVVADPFKEQAVHYYDFAQLNHFLDYMSERRSEKIKSISKKFREKARDPEFRQNVSNVRLEERNNGFYLLADAYNMVTPTQGPYPYSGYNGMYSPYGGTYPFTPFASRYYNSPYSFNNQPLRSDISIMSTSVVAFTSDGQLDWDSSLKVDDVHRPNLEQASDFWCDRNKIVITTKNESELMMNARFKNSELLTDTVKVIVNKPTEFIRDETRHDGGVRYWFDNKFYVWGYQSVRDQESAAGEKNRSVFYMIKVDAY